MVSVAITAICWPRISATQNRYGPWQPILEWRRQNLPLTNGLEESAYAAGKR